MSDVKGKNLLSSSLEFQLELIQLYTTGFQLLYIGLKRIPAFVISSTLQTYNYDRYVPTKLISSTFLHQRHHLPFSGACFFGLLRDFALDAWEPVPHKGSTASRWASERSQIPKLWRLLYVIFFHRKRNPRLKTLSTDVTHSIALKIKQPKIRTLESPFLLPASWSEVLEPPVIVWCPSSNCKKSTNLLRCPHKNITDNLEIVHTAEYQKHGLACAKSVTPNFSVRCL